MEENKYLLPNYFLNIKLSWKVELSKYNNWFSTLSYYKLNNYNELKS